jgi:large subunit ribosomal protein L9
MKVILTEKVKSLGNIGEIVNVSAGYGRNYLMPNRFAVLADSSNKKQLAHQEKALAKKMDEQKADAEKLRSKVDGLNLEFIKRVSGSGKLFGTVTNADLAKELEDKGFDVEKRQISVEAPIKSLGAYTVKAKLFKDVEAEFTVKVSMDPNQAEEMKKKQELAAKKKEAQAAEAEKKASEEGEESSEEKAAEEAPMTEEQKLKAEADRLLRS